ncbi:TetR/AcrR family transcriptional regulator [Cryptosporangium aurantiacum]|uniref:Transcriptional regulator, TetR family n=1 Tax=Cryptosporangium aurantiacum TaxID=134849 RepID=A0A1M7TY67_9ACTN|nr:TetR/AcrR family transcriptional regulator [Cryptosporangium aurantiacum]SHN75712.1 transcriptional regulator, TetR family [Cryptosporangium aurantiacum]
MAEPPAPSGPDAAPRRRDAARTRRLLLEVARRRFARDGYAATTVRDIAEDAGVNVALISRYYASKEGLFEACLADATTELDRDTEIHSPTQVAADIAERIAGSAADDQVQDGLLLLLRSSGEERVDELRRRLLGSISRRLARTATGTDETPSEPTVLRAQIVLAAALGIALLRTSPGAQPLASASAQDLEAPLSDLVTALLTK